MTRRGSGSSRSEWGRVSRSWGALVGVAILLAGGVLAMGQVHTRTLSSPGGGYATLSYEFTGFIMGSAEDETWVSDEFPKTSTYRVDRVYASGTVPGAPGTKLSVKVTASVGGLPKPVFEDARIWVRLMLWGPGDDGQRVDDTRERLVVLANGGSTEIVLSLDLLERHRHASIDIQMSVGSRDVEAFPNGQKRGDRAHVQAGFNVVRGQAPTVRITYTPENPVIGDQMLFTAASSGFGVGTLHHTWYLNGTEQARVHGPVMVWEEAKAGNHTVRVVVSDGQGATSEATVEFSVRQFHYLIVQGDESAGDPNIAIVDEIWIKGRKVTDRSEFKELGMALHTGAIVKTGPEAEILLRFVVGPFARVNPSSTLTCFILERPVGSYRELMIRLLGGIHDFYYPPGWEAQRKFEVDTDTAITSIKGTRLTVSLIDGVTTVTVTEGEVEVTHKETGHTTTVRAGETWKSDDTTPPPSDDATSHTYGGTAGWYLVSTPGAASPHAGITMWWWNPGTKSYDRPSGLQPEMGYWARLEANTQLSVTSTAPTSNATLSLGVVGWHMVSAPWTFPKAAIQVVRGTETKSWADAVAAGWIRNAIYGFRAGDGAYTMPATLHPWYGYWLDAKVAGLSLLFSYASRSSTLGLVDDGPAPLVPLWADPSDLPPPPPLEASGAGAIQVANVPNPITDVYTTTFRVLGPMASSVTGITVSVYDLSGKLVWQGSAAGAELTWHTADLAGRYLANGVYVYQVTAQVAGTTVTSGLMKLSVLR